MDTEWVDFRTVKAAVRMQQIVDHYGIRLRKVNANYLRGKCPLPTHSSQASDNSFGVDLQKQVWACQSDSCAKERAGRRGGNVLEFVAVKEGVSVREAALKIASWFNIVSRGPADGLATANHSQPVKHEPQAKAAEPHEEGTQIPGYNKPLTFTLKGVDPRHPYIEQRGISEETAGLFGVGYFPGNGSMKDRIVFPICNGAGEIVAYAGRAVEDSVEPRWKFPSGFHKSLELFGVQEAKGSPVIGLVESFWGVLALRQAGIRAVALMGRSMSCEQQALLTSLNPVSIAVILDGDEPGRAAAPEIALRLVRQQFVRIVDFPADKQPDQVKPEELRKLLDPSFVEPRA